MILRDFFTAVASAFAPMAVNKKVHDSISIRAAAMAGQKMVIDLADQRRAAWERGDRDAVKRATDRQSSVMSGLDDLAQRLEKK